jgi:ATP-dependent HslUV protease ATP-binding subunit HslU
MNINVENIGARRLHTIIEKVLEDISFNACESEEKLLTLDEAYVKEKLAVLDDKVNLDNCIL